MVICRGGVLYFELQKYSVGYCTHAHILLGASAARFLRAGSGGIAWSGHAGGMLRGSHQRDVGRDLRSPLPQ